MASPLPPLTLVLGGARSGKSRYGEGMVLRSGLEPVYIATAEALDEEMTERIANHRAARDARWRTIEEPLALADALERAARPERAVLVDCLTLWLTNLMGAGRDVPLEIRALEIAVGRLTGPVVLVSNEVGLGVVPTSSVARAFIDHAGRLHQKVAALADAVVLMYAGLPLHLKRPGDI